MLKKYNLTKNEIMNPILNNIEQKNFVSKRKLKKDDFLWNIKNTYSFLLTIVVWLLIYYVWILNVNATQWYNIRKLEIEKRNLLMEKEILEVKIAELESSSNITKKDLEWMEKIDDNDKNFLVIKNNIQYTYAD